MNIAFKNYSRRTPDRWKRLGDFFLYSIPFVEGVLKMMPSDVDSLTREWIGFIWIMTSSLIKILTKYMANEPLK